MYHYNHSDGHVNFNSDLSGEVQIVNSKGKEFWVSGALLLSFVSTYIKDHMVPNIKTEVPVIAAEPSYIHSDIIK